MERGIIRFLYGRPLETLLATWGVSLMLQQVVRAIFGAPNKEVSNPGWMTGGFEAMPAWSLTYNRIAIIVFAIVVLGVLRCIAAPHPLRPADARGHPEPRAWRPPWASAPAGWTR